MEWIWKVRPRPWQKWPKEFEKGSFDWFLVRVRGSRHSYLHDVWLSDWMRDKRNIATYGLTCCRHTLQFLPWYTIFFLVIWFTSVWYGIFSSSDALRIEPNKRKSSVPLFWLIITVLRLYELILLWLFQWQIYTYFIVFMTNKCVFRCLLCVWGKKTPNTGFKLLFGKRANVLKDNSATRKGRITPRT